VENAALPVFKLPHITYSKNAKVEVVLLVMAGIPVIVLKKLFLRVIARGVLGCYIFVSWFWESIVLK